MPKEFILSPTNDIYLILILPKFLQSRHIISCTANTCEISSNYLLLCFGPTSATAAKNKGNNNINAHNKYKMAKTCRFRITTWKWFVSQSAAHINFDFQFRTAAPASSEEWKAGGTPQPHTWAIFCPLDQAANSIRPQMLPENRKRLHRQQLCCRCCYCCCCSVLFLSQWRRP